MNLLRGMVICKYVHVLPILLPSLVVNVAQRFLGISDQMRGRHQELDQYGNFCLKKYVIANKFSIKCFGLLNLKLKLKAYSRSRGGGVLEIFLMERPNLDISLSLQFLLDVSAFFFLGGSMFHFLRKVYVQLPIVFNLRTKTSEKSLASCLHHGGLEVGVKTH